MLAESFRRPAIELRTCSLSGNLLLQKLKREVLLPVRQKRLELLVPAFFLEAGGSLLRRFGGVCGSGKVSSEPFVVFARRVLVIDKQDEGAYNDETEQGGDQITSLEG